MRFSLFVHMERWDETVSHQELFENLTELTLIAEAGGFSTVWIGESTAGAPERWVQGQKSLSMP